MPAIARPFDYARILRRVRTGYIPSSIRTDLPRATGSNKNPAKDGEEPNGGSTCQALVLVSLDNPWPDVGNANPGINTAVDAKEDDEEDADAEEADAEEADAEDAEAPATAEGVQVEAGMDNDDNTPESGVADGDHTTHAAALGASESILLGTAPAEALHTFTLDSGASRCFFCDTTTLTPLSSPVPVRLAGPSGGPVLARSSTMLPCLAVPSSSLSGLHLPSFSTNLVSAAALQNAIVTTTTPRGLSLYTLATEPPQVAASAQVSASCQVAPPCSYRLLSHQTLLWHHRLRHPSLPRHRGMHSCLLASVLPRSLHPLPPSRAPPCLPCAEGRQRAAPHSSFPVTTAPLQTLHMDVWGLARVSGEGRERYFLLVVDDYTRYIMVFPLRIKGGEFSSNLLRDFCHGKDILQSFTLTESPQKNGIAERCMGLVMEVARTPVIHVAAPHFLWPFAVRYAAHQLNLWPCVSMLETSPTLRWTGKVGDASVFQFYHPTSRRVFPSQDVTFDESVPFYRLCPYCSAPPPPLSLFLAPGPPPLDPLPPQGPSPSDVSQVDPLPGTARVEVAVGSGAARGAASGGAEPGGAESEGAGSRGAERGGAEPGGAEPGGVEPAGAEPEGDESGGAEARGLFLLLRRTRLRSGAAGAWDSAAGDTGARGAGVTTRAGGTGRAAAAGPGGARTRGTGAAATGGVGGVGAGDPTEPGAAGAEGAGAGGTGAGGAGVGGAGATDPGAGGAGRTVRRRLFIIPLLQQSASPLPAPSPYTEQTGGLTERREPASRPASPVCTGRRVPCLHPPPVPGTHAMALRPSSVPLRVPLPVPPASSLPAVPDP
ncbi:unnamed protein product [Closterium sp. NIES-53]